ncbi:hypothetical protein Emtol_2908 [Emticicia oligotrophica DSM 17448]|uniref:Uncharacterized protein n=1 Tax=Emticicia oligotrophica (strain DSM 17448 / CIP 109782 / MTCC 6937 / GPTSA100-15) TaxID=929562 RepID=A0ABN4APA7_EMTOG|nr:hypothetical protein Emtol_2908 [Emticicia oligotrophica DSM 17448]
MNYEIICRFCRSKIYDNRATHNSYLISNDFAMTIPQKFCQRPTKVLFSAKISVLTDKNVSKTDMFFCVILRNSNKCQYLTQKKLYYLKLNLNAKPNEFSSGLSCKLAEVGCPSA